MSVSHATDYLPKEKPCFVFADIIILYVIVQFSSICEFHDDKDVVGGVEYFIKFDDVLMADEF
jgi:hypothetical protein